MIIDRRERNQGVSNVLAIDGGSSRSLSDSRIISVPPADTRSLAEPFRILKSMLGLMGY